MQANECRLYVGNLPDDITEEQIKKKFRKYGISCVHIKQQNNYVDTNTFAFINISSQHVDNCLEKFRTQKWKHRYVKIEKARERFIDILQTEIREEEVIESSPPNSPPRPVPLRLTPRPAGRYFAYLYYHAEIERDRRINERMNREALQINGRVNQEPPQINGRVNQEPPQINGRVNQEPPQINGRVNQEPPQINERMNREPPREEQASSGQEGTPRLNSDLENIVGERKYNFPVTKVGNKKKEDDDLENPLLMFATPNTPIFSPDKWKPNQKPVMISPATNNKITSDLKRLKALDDKRKLISQKRQFVNDALCNMGTSKSKRICFKDDNVDDNYRGKGEVKNGPETKKLDLFEDESDEDDDFVPDFEHKSQFEGKNGAKLLQLKAKLSGDDRFKLDGRFLDSETTNVEVPNEKERQLNILSGITGHDFHKTLDKADKFAVPSIIRYDPSKPEHKKYEIGVSDNVAVNTKKRKKKSKEKMTTTDLKENAELKSNISSEIIVSKEKFYSVDSTVLKEAFEKSDDKPTFSLLQMFDSEKKSSSGGDTLKLEKDRESIDKPKAISLKKYIANPYENHSSTSESEDDEVPVQISLDPTPSEKVLGAHGIWSDACFFKPGGARLKEAAEFYRVTDDKYVANFDRLRTELRSRVKKKLKNSQRDKRLFKQKVGGKFNKGKFKNRLQRLKI